MGVPASLAVLRLCELVLGCVRTTVRLITLSVFPRSSRRIQGCSTCSTTVSRRNGKNSRGAEAEGSGHAELRTARSLHFHVISNGFTLSPLFPRARAPPVKSETPTAWELHALPSLRRRLRGSSSSTLTLLIITFHPSSGRRKSQLTRRSSRSPTSHPWCPSANPTPPHHTTPRFQPLKRSIIIVPYLPSLGSLCAAHA